MAEIDDDSFPSIVERNGGETLKIDETMKHHLLDGLKMLATYDTDDEDEMRGGEENQAKKKLKFGDDAEDSTEKTERQREQEDGSLKGAKNLEDGLNEEIERRKTHDLPRSLFGKTRGLSTNGGDGSRIGENRDSFESSKTDETLKKMLATRDADVDMFETAKNCGMTFPCSRFLLDTKKN